MPQGRRKPVATLAATVHKIIKPRFGNGPEKAEIVLDKGEPFYREIRIDNNLKDSQGKDVALKPGSEVDVIVEADEQSTETKSN